MFWSSPEFCGHLCIANLIILEHGMPNLWQQRGGQKVNKGDSRPPPLPGCCRQRHLKSTVTASDQPPPIAFPTASDALPARSPFPFLMHPAPLSRPIPLGG